MSGKRRPFTKHERHRWAQNGIGHRAVNNWGSGDLPAPFAEGDVVRWDGTPCERLRGQVGPLFVVTYCCSIDDGDAWYARVYDGTGEFGSDRLHIAWADRSTHDEDCNYMASFTLVESADPEGLALREQMLADGWTFQKPFTCPTCGQRTWNDAS